MMDGFLLTVSGFKSYERWSFATFFLLGVLYSITENWAAFLVTWLACAWVYTSSGWRQKAS